MNYNIAANMGMTPHGILMSPYGSVNEVVIIGEAYDTGGNGSFTNKGFFALFDTTSLNNNSCNVIGQTPGNPLPDDRFQSITVANNSGGYVIGGYSNMYPGAFDGNLWTLDVTSVGNIGGFNNVHTPSTYNLSRSITGITERFSSTFGYMYYAVIEESGSNDMMAIRLDNTGSPFVATFPNIFNEFHYSSAGGNAPGGVAISFLDNGGTNDIGFHLFGTDDNVNGGRYLFVESTFSGDQGCPASLAGLLGTNSGPNDVNAVGINNLSGLTACNNFSLAQLSITPSATYVCGSGTVMPTFGSNLRANLTTSTNEISEKMSTFEMYPNPSDDKLILNLNQEINEDVKIKIFNCIGQEIKNFKFESHALESKTEIELNFKDTDLNDGIYYIKLINSGNTYNGRFIHNESK